MTKVLIASGADLDLCSSAGVSPLQMAVYEYNLDVVKLLVENGASINTQDLCGGASFHYAVIGNCMKIITYLIENGADLKLRTKHFRNNSIELALKGKKIDIVKKLIHH